MRDIAIIGAGQSGLQLGIGLKKSGFNVTIYTNKTAEEVLNGKIMSSQALFHTALENEKTLGLDFWNTSCPKNESITYTLVGENKNSEEIYWKGITENNYQSVDQRLKFSRWMNEFESLSGTICIQNVDIKILENISKKHELTIIAGGKSEISQLFPINKAYSRFEKPQRIISCLYVKGVIPETNSPGVRINIIPNIGEYLTMPGLTLSGQCNMLMFIGIPGGPFDCLNGINHPEEHFNLGLKLLKDLIPQEAEYCKNAELTDQQAVIRGYCIPTVKFPTFKLPNGKSILGIGDTLVLNDPLGGQGANNASKAASLYLKRIIKQGNSPFNESWMQETFNLYWHRFGKWSTKFTNMLLLPPQSHIIKLFKAASEYPVAANTLANGFDDPSHLFPWISDSEDTLAIINSLK